MTQPPARYLLRFDDLCPTMHRAGWERFLPLLARYKIKPILAIVPDNRDPGLELAVPDSSFWQQMRELEAAGATIALHGYRHLCTQRGASLIPLHGESEFAGATEIQQREWIRSGLEILHKHGLNPRIFVAPRHGLDRSTLRALKQEGIEVISDGFASRPFLRGGLTWIPQQLWAPVKKSTGLWTICLHSNTASSQAVAELHSFLESNSASFTTIDQALEDFPPLPLSQLESLQARLEIVKIRVRRFRKSITR